MLRNDKIVRRPDPLGQQGIQGTGHQGVRETHENAEELGLTAIKYNNVSPSKWSVTPRMYSEERER